MSWRDGDDMDAIIAGPQDGRDEREASMSDVYDDADVDSREDLSDMEIPVNINGQSSDWLERFAS